jgi:hypothetical protein
MEPETAIRSRKRASRGESRRVYASTFGAGRREVALDAKTGRANERARAGADTRGASRGHTDEEVLGARGSDGQDKASARPGAVEAGWLRCWRD